MGLDNGIIIHTNGKFTGRMPDNIKKSGQAVVHYSHDNIDEHGYMVGVPTGQYSYEIAYWRKFWPMRNAFFETFYESSESDGETIMTPEMVDWFEEVITENYNPKRFHELSSGYWEWNEHRKNEKNELLDNLRWLRNFMDMYPEAEVIFYDSY